jgi:hypothetical protein
MPDSAYFIPSELTTCSQFMAAGIDFLRVVIFVTRTDVAVNTVSLPRSAECRVVTTDLTDLSFHSVLVAQPEAR